MKKTLLFATTAFMLFAASCKETLTPIIINTSGASDTFYIDSIVSTPQTKRVLIEELTGVSCVNCPKATETLKEFEKTYKDQLSIIAFHAGGLTDKLQESDPKQTLVTEDAPYLFAIWGPEYAKPFAVFDRLKLGSKDDYPFWVLYRDSDWKAALLKARETTQTPVNLEVTSTYNEQTEEYKITTTVKYTESTSTQFALNIYLTEDSIVDAQKFSLPTGDSIATHYVFNHVYRKSLTNIDKAEEILPDMAKKEAKLVYVSKRVFKIDPTKNWNSKNMHIVAFITENTEDKRVVQVIETKL